MNTIGFNVIAGTDYKELEFLLKSISTLGFDEIVVTVTQPEKKTFDVAEKYATKVCNFEWINDFAAARQYCLDNTKTDFIVWADADDVVPFDNSMNWIKFLHYVRNQNDFDYFGCRYHVSHGSKSGKPIEVINRLFCYRKHKDFYWKYPIHEILKIKNKSKHKFQVFNDIIIEHRPIKKSSYERNIGIFNAIMEKKEYKDDQRMRLYYGRELFLTEDTKQKGVEILKGVIDDQGASEEELASSCGLIGLYYAFGGRNDFKINPKGIDVAETYCRIGLGYSEKYAELHVIIGDIQLHRKNLNHAIEHYKKAMQCTQNGNMSQDRRFYTILPATRLSSIYFQLKDYEQALIYNKHALKEFKSPELIENRKKIIRALESEY